MIKIAPFILLFTLFSCNGKEMKRDQNNNCKFIDTLTQNDLKLLKGINIGVREQGEIVRRFRVTFEKVEYHLPIYDTFNTWETIMNSKRYDVEKYALSRGVDSLGSHEYVHAYSDSIIAVFNKAKVLGIYNDPELGDFIFFTVSPTEEIIYLPKGAKVYHEFWKKFFKKAEKIKEGWYIRYKGKK